MGRRLYSLWPDEVGLPVVREVIALRFYSVNRSRLAAYCQLGFTSSLVLFGRPPDTVAKDSVAVENLMVGSLKCHRIERGLAT